MSYLYLVLRSYKSVVSEFFPSNSIYITFAAPLVYMVAQSILCVCAVCVWFLLLFLLSQIFLKPDFQHHDQSKERKEEKKLVVERLFLESFKFWNVLLSCRLVNLISNRALNREIFLCALLYVYALYKEREYIWLTVDIHSLFVVFLHSITHNVLEFRNVGISVAVL